MRRGLCAIGVSLFGILLATTPECGAQSANVGGVDPSKPSLTISDLQAARNQLKAVSEQLERSMAEIRARIDSIDRRLLAETKRLETERKFAESQPRDREPRVRLRAAETPRQVRTQEVRAEPGSKTSLEKVKLDLKWSAQSVMAVEPKVRDAVELVNLARHLWTQPNNMLHEVRIAALTPKLVLIAGPVEDVKLVFHLLKNLDDGNYTEAIESFGFERIEVRHIPARQFANVCNALFPNSDRMVTDERTRSVLFPKNPDLLAAARKVATLIDKPEAAPSKPTFSVMDPNGKPGEKLLKHLRSLSLEEREKYIQSQVPSFLQQRIRASLATEKAK